MEAIEEVKEVIVKDVLNNNKLNKIEETYLLNALDLELSYLLSDSMNVNTDYYYQELEKLRASKFTYSGFFEEWLFNIDSIVIKIREEILLSKEYIKELRKKNNPENEDYKYIIEWTDKIKEAYICLSDYSSAGYLLFAKEQGGLLDYSELISDGESVKDYNVQNKTLEFYQALEEKTTNIENVKLKIRTKNKLQK